MRERLTALALNGNKAATGDTRALRLLLELARDAEAKQNLEGVQNPIVGELGNRAKWGP